jgi:MFS family permease
VEKRATAVGIWSAVSGVAAAAGPPLGGLLVEIDWRWVFIVNVPIGIAFLALGSRVLVNRREEQAQERPDVLGAGLFTIAIGALILAIIQGQSWGWSSGRVIGLFVAAAVLSAIVAIRCARHPVPLVEPVIVRTRAIALANVSALVLFMGFAALILGGVLFQTEVWGVSVLTAGLQLAPAPLTSAIFAVPGAVLGQRFGQRYVGAAGAVLFALGALWLYTHLELEPDFASDMLPSTLIGGAGIGLILPTLSAAATGPLPPSRFATGTAVLGMTRQVGSALGVALFVAILGQPTPATVIDDFRDVWMFLIACGLAAAAAMLAVGPVRIGAPGISAGTAAVETAGPGTSPFASYNENPLETRINQR